MRGLKLSAFVKAMQGKRVAPYVGAWIETNHINEPHDYHVVAPYVGAWIETVYINNALHDGLVAPYVGAWIET